MRREDSEEFGWRTSRYGDCEFREGNRRRNEPPMANRTSNNQKIRCNCKKYKQEEFFDKLLNYLEKQSEIITECYLSKDRALLASRGAHDMPRSKECACGNVIKHDSAARGGQGAASSRTLARDKSQKAEDLGSLCNVFLSHCTCSGVKSNVGGVSSRISTPKKSALNLPAERSKSWKDPADERECNNKVSRFFDLAEEICKVYLSHCSVPDVNQHEDNCDIVTSDPAEPTNQTFVCTDCCCQSHDKPPQNERRNRTCFDLFEEKYGQILMDLSNQPRSSGSQSRGSAKQLHPSATGEPSNTKKSNLRGPSQHRQHPFHVRSSSRLEDDFRSRSPTSQRNHSSSQTSLTDQEKAVPTYRRPSATNQSDQFPANSPKEPESSKKGGWGRKKK